MSQIKAPILYDQSESKIIVCLPPLLQEYSFPRKPYLYTGWFCLSRTDIAVIGIRHFTGAIHNASHYTDLQLSSVKWQLWCERLFSPNRRAYVHSRDKKYIPFWKYGYGRPARFRKRLHQRQHGSGPLDWTRKFRPHRPSKISAPISDSQTYL